MIVAQTHTFSHSNKVNDFVAARTPFEHVKAAPPK